MLKIATIIFFLLLIAAPLLVRFRPRWVAAFNLKVTNRLTAPFVTWLPGFGVVTHVIGRYDPASKRVDWVLGTGQDRTHMIMVTKDHKDIITSNVNSGTISMIEYVEPASSGPRPPQGAARKTWEVTNIPAGNGVEGI